MSDSDDVPQGRVAKNNSHVPLIGRALSESACLSIGFPMNDLERGARIVQGAPRVLVFHLNRSADHMAEMVSLHVPVFNGCPDRISFPGCED